MQGAPKMTRPFHRWTEPQRPSGLLEVDESNPHRVEHWKEFYAIDAPDVRMTVMPECVREKREDA